MAEWPVKAHGGHTRRAAGLLHRKKEKKQYLERALEKLRGTHKYTSCHWTPKGRHNLCIDKGDDAS